MKPRSDPGSPIQTPLLLRTALPLREHTDDIITGGHGKPVCRPRVAPELPSSQSKEKVVELQDVFLSTRQSPSPWPRDRPITCQIQETHLTTRPHTSRPAYWPRPSWGPQSRPETVALSRQSLCE